MRRFQGALGGLALGLLLFSAGCGPKTPALEPIRTRQAVLGLLDDYANMTLLVEQGPQLAPRLSPPLSVTPYPRARGESRPALLVPLGTCLRIPLPSGNAGMQLELALAIPQMGHSSWESKFKRAGQLGVELRLEGGAGERLELDIGVDLEHPGRGWSERRLALNGEEFIEIRSAAPRDLTGVALGIAGLNLIEVLEIPRATLGPERPGLLFVTIDTLRADRLGCYGSIRPTSPELDRLAQGGLLFEQAYSPAPWTWPSTASLLTGLPPPAHGVLSAVQCQLAGSLTSLGEVLQQQGFTTGFFTTNPLLTTERGFAQGFERFQGGQWEAGQGLLQAAERWLDEFPGARPGFYFQPTEPHLPYTPPERFRAQIGLPADPEGFDMEQYRRGAQDWPSISPVDQERLRQMAAHASCLYDAEVAAADAWFGELRSSLERRGMWDQMIVAVTSDHGEEFFEHGLPAHARQLYPESLHVPLLLFGPGVAPGRCPTPVPLEALPGSLLRLLSVPPQGAFDGLDLCALAAGNEAGPERLFASTHSGWWPNLAPPVELHSVVSRELVHLRAAPLDNPADLPAQTANFAPPEDPGWQQPLSGADLEARGLTALRLDLDRRLVAWWQSESLRAPRVHQGADAEALLRAAGYLESRR